jgi:hypothetical protein
MSKEVVTAIGAGGRPDIQMDSNSIGSRNQRKKLLLGWRLMATKDCKRWVVSEHLLGD